MKTRDADRTGPPRRPSSECTPCEPTSASHSSAASMHFLAARAMNGERHRWRRASPKKERPPGDARWLACAAPTPEIHKYERAHFGNYSQGAAARDIFSPLPNFIIDDPRLYFVLLILTSPLGRKEKPVGRNCLFDFRESSSWLSK